MTTTSSECVEARNTAITIGRPLVDAVKLETCIAVWELTPGARTFVVNLHTGGDVVELTAHRAREAADKLRTLAAAIDALADDADNLTELEASFTAVLNGRSRALA
jgi:hypothetical protein